MSQEPLSKENPDAVHYASGTPGARTACGLSSAPGLKATFSWRHVTCGACKGARRN